MKRTPYVESKSAARQRKHVKKTKGNKPVTLNNRPHVGTYGESIRPWTGITARHWLDIPWQCVCMWSETQGRLELKFPYGMCPVEGHAKLCIRTAV